MWKQRILARKLRIAELESSMTIMQRIEAKEQAILFSSQHSLELTERNIGLNSGWYDARDRRWRQMPTRSR